MTDSTPIDEAGEPEAHHVTLLFTPATDRSGRYLVVAANAGGEFHRDTVDLNSAISRKRFIDATVGKTLSKGSADELRVTLEKQLLDAARVPPGGTEPDTTTSPEEPVDPRIEALAKMPEDIRAEAVAMLESSNLIRKVAEDIEAIGVVGESNTALCVYLVGTSVQLKKPLAAIVRGSSASGKSFIVERTSSLFPPEIVLQATSLTTNALFYFAPGELMHRWIVAGERSRLEDDDRAEATRALREMIESGKLSKAVAGKDSHGEIVTKMIEQEGPVAFVETTTLGQIFDEDANRCLLLATDESKAQTQAIMDATARRATGLDVETHDRIREVHFAIQRMIPRADVLVPFATQISKLYPSEQVEARRSFRHLLNVTRASALLHFRQRERDHLGRIVATYADYAIAENLARAPLADASSGVSAAARKYLEALQEKHTLSTFSTSDAQKVGLGSRATRYRRLLELHNAGAIEQTEPQRGRVPAQWRLVEMDLDSGTSGLPTVEKVMDGHPGETLRHKP